MKEVIRYTIFKTKWGYFGLLGVENGILRSRLPIAARERAKYELLKTFGADKYGQLKDLRGVRYDKGAFPQIAEKVTAYFEGAYVEFRRDVPILLDGLGGFAERVLRACRDVSYGKTISYGRLAKRVGRSGAARAVGRVLGNNPLPLLIPCHRVTYSGGGVGGFSAIGGVGLKKRMLELERKAVQ